MLSRAGEVSSVLTAAARGCCARYSAAAAHLPPLRPLRLFSNLVDAGAVIRRRSVGQLAAQGSSNKVVAGSTACAAQKLQLSFLRNLLGVRQRTPSAVVLAAL